MGYSHENLRTDDRAHEALVRQTTQMEKGSVAATALDTVLVEYDAAKQWDIEKLMPVLRAAAGSQLGPDRLVLGVTNLDLFGGAGKFLFGVAQPGEYLGLISARRFMAAFNTEPPKRERLKDRLLKQALSSIGSMLGVPRCNTPECARAYPRSLAEHDQKPATLCPECRAGFEKNHHKK